MFPTVEKTGTPIQQFIGVFNQEHEHILDLILQLISSCEDSNLKSMRSIVAEMRAYCGPHFRYEEECLYPSLIQFFERGHIESLIREHVRCSQHLIR